MQCEHIHHQASVTTPVEWTNKNNAYAVAIGWSHSATVYFTEMAR